MKRSAHWNIPCACGGHHTNDLLPLIFLQLNALNIQPNEFMHRNTCHIAECGKTIFFGHVESYLALQPDLRSIQDCLNVLAVGQGNENSGLGHVLDRTHEGSQGSFKWNGGDRKRLSQNAARYGCPVTKAGEDSHRDGYRVCRTGLRNRDDFFYIINRQASLAGQL
jgi:hypothetical protein